VPSNFQPIAKGIHQIIERMKKGPRRRMVDAALKPVKPAAAQGEEGDKTAEPGDTGPEKGRGEGL